MFLRRFFEPTLAQTSYLIGCPESGEAIVIDPNRDVAPYLAAAKSEGARITHVTETHIHADFVSGTREVAAQTGATMLLSAEGGTDWQYAFAGDKGARAVCHGDSITLGNVRIDVLHTPGHTPEHLTFVVTDGSAASEPIGAATGDFLFVGDVGRPDLLEKAARIAGTMEVGAHQLYRSLREFSSRPDWLQIWPGHGAGSACGKGISAIPQSTLGYEKRFNWAFRAETEDAFVKGVLAGQPDPPKYFATMKHMNKDGPRVLGGWPTPPQLGAGDPAAAAAVIADRLRDGAPVIDTRHANEFATGHIPGTVNIPLNGSFTNWAGWLLPYDRDLTLIVSSEAALESAVRYLALIGLDRVEGFVQADAVDKWHGPLGTIARIGTGDLAESLKHRGVTLVDVRNDSEWTGLGHIPGAIHVPLGHLTERLAEIPRERPVVVQCLGGSRSAIGASLLRAAGYPNVINFSPGISGWISDGRDVVGQGSDHA